MGTHFDRLVDADWAPRRFEPGADGSFCQYFSHSVRESRRGGLPRFLHILLVSSCCLTLGPASRRMLTTVNPTQTPANLLCVCSP